MSTIICTLIGGNQATIPVYLEDDGRIHFTADCDIDADGANGQAGEKAAYRVDDKGSEYLANGGMKKGGTAGVTWAADWGKDIVLVRNGQPMVLPDGTIPSKTSYRWPDKSANDPAAYVDAATVPYGVLSPKIVKAVPPRFLGCRMRITFNGQSVIAVMADIGPRSKCGEASIAAAKAIGIPSSPRTGGEERNVVLYECWPGVAAVVNGVEYPLLPFGG